LPDALRQVRQGIDNNVQAKKSTQQKAPCPRGQGAFLPDSLQGTVVTVPCH